MAAVAAFCFGFFYLSFQPLYSVRQRRAVHFKCCLRNHLELNGQKVRTEPAGVTAWINASLLCSNYLEYETGLCRVSENFVCNLQK